MIASIGTALATHQGLSFVALGFDIDVCLDLDLVGEQNGFLAIELREEQRMMHHDHDIQLIFRQLSTLVLSVLRDAHIERGAARIAMRYRERFADFRWVWIASLYSVPTGLLSVPTCLLSPDQTSLSEVGTRSGPNSGLSRLVSLAMELGQGGGVKQSLALSNMPLVN